MSYIRCTSNPEGLYIYGTSAGKGKAMYISISATDENVGRQDGKPAIYPDNELSPTVKEFYAACEAYKKAWGDLDKPIVRGEFSIREVWVSEETDEILTDEKLKEYNDKYHKAFQAATDAALPKARRKVQWNAMRRYSTNHKVGLFWRNRSTVLWETTWWYVVDNVVADIERDRKDRAKARKKALAKKARKA